MIRGVIEPDGSPRVFGFVRSPTLHAQGWVKFLVDTGAAGTCLHPSDAHKIGINLGQLEYSSTNQGVGGMARYAQQSAYIFFHDSEGGWASYTVDLQIAKLTPDNLEFPSLLGRDILSQLGMLYSPSRKVLSFDN